jgi:hypothetical protein
VLVVDAVVVCYIDVLACDFWVSVVDATTYLPTHSGVGLPPLLLAPVWPELGRASAPLAGPGPPATTAITL